MIPDTFDNHDKTERIQHMLGKLSISDLKKEVWWLFFFLSRIQFGWKRWLTFFFVQKAKELKDKFDSQIHNLVFSHNDTLPQNFIFCEDSGSIKIIDYEYAGYNYQGKNKEKKT